MATNIFTRAKSIRRKHPKLSWQECVKRAGRQHGKRKKISGHHKMKAPKKRKRVGAVTRNTDKTDNKRVSVNIGSIHSQKAALRKAISIKVGDLEAKKLAAKTVRAKRVYIRQIYALKIEYRKIQ